MSRNGSGTYALPAGNPVISGTTISSTWANDTLADLATEMSDSLSRSGKGGMLAVLRGIDGAVSAPALSWTNETGSGLYRAAAGDCRFAILGSDVLTVTSAGLGVTGTLTVSGLTTLADLTATGTLTFTGATIADGGTVTTIDIDGGTIDGTVIGGTTPAAGTFTALTASSGAIDGSPVGGTTPAAGTFTDLTATTTADFTGATTTIDGGTINGTNVGGTTPAVGVFTDLQCNGAAFFPSPKSTPEVVLGGTTHDIDAEIVQYTDISLNNNITITISNWPVGVPTPNRAGYLAVRIKQAAGGAHTVTWPVDVLWDGGSAPATIPAGQTAVYILHCFGTSAFLATELGRDFS